MKLFPLLLILMSCAPLTEEQRYARDDSLAIAKDKFFSLQERCRATGGYMVVTRPMNEMSHWTKWDFLSAKCAKHRIY